MSLGLCCHWLDSQGKNILRIRQLRYTTFQKGGYSEAQIYQTYLDNCKILLEYLPVIFGAGIRSFRVSSCMFSLHDKVPRSLWDDGEIRKILSQAGDFAKSKGMRITSHPDQYCMLNASKPESIRNAISILNHHGWLFDMMGLDQTPYYSINIHGGRKEQGALFAQSFQQLDESVRSRLTVENCEFAYSVSQLLPISQELDIPVCFDSHHHRFNDGGMSVEDALRASMETWKGVVANTHLSNTPPELKSETKVSKLRKHSDKIYEIPDCQRELNNSGDIDIDVEAKSKQYAIFDMPRELGIIL